MITWVKEYETAEYIYDHIMIGLMPYGDDEGLAIQATEFDGIEQYLYVIIPDTEGRFASFKVKEWMIERMELDDALLWERAAENTRRQMCIQSMSEVLGVGPMFPMIVTNRTKMRGAAAILFARAELKPGKYIALPSSIHEFLLVQDEGQDIDEMSDMVKAINHAEVEPEERLSDRAYRFEVK